MPFGFMQYLQHGKMQEKHGNKGKKPCYVIEDVDKAFDGIHT